jgi:hypothetical protein
LTVAANPFPRPGQGGTGPLPADATRDGTAADGVPWPAWLDTDTFDGLGEEAWLASLADQEPELADPADAELEGAEPEFEWARLEFGQAGLGELPDMANGAPGPSAPDSRGPSGAGGPQGGPDAGFGPGGTAKSMAPGAALCELTEGAIADGLPVGHMVTEVGSALNGKRRKFLALLRDQSVCAARAVATLTGDQP